MTRLLSFASGKSAAFLTFLLLFVVIGTVVGCGSGGGGNGLPAIDMGAAPSAPGFSGGSPEARLLLEDTFETGGFSPRWNGAVLNREYYAGGADPFPRVPGHGTVMHYFIPAGVDEFIPIQVGAYGPDAFAQITGRPEVDEFYVEWEEYFAPGHDFANGAQKILRFNREPENGIRTGTEVNFWLQVDNGNLQLFFFHPTGNRGEPIDMATNTNLGVPTGQWVKFGVWCKLNTPGQSDGFGRVFMDGQLLIDMSGINNRGSSTAGWNEMWIGGNHTNWGPTSVDSSRYIDNIRWYDTLPMQ